MNQKIILIYRVRRFSENTPENKNVVLVVVGDFFFLSWLVDCCLLVTIRDLFRRKDLG